MLDFPLTENKPLFKKLWRVFLLIAILQCLGAIVFGWGLRTVIGGGLGWFQIAMSSLMLVFLLALAYLLLETWTHPGRMDNHIERVIGALRSPRSFAVIALVSGSAFILGTFFATLTPEISEPFTRAIWLRLLPIVVLAAGLGLQTVAGLLILRPGSFMTLTDKKLFLFILLVAAGMFLYWGWLAEAIVPVAARVEGWNTLGTPLMELQVLIAWGIGMGMLALIGLANSHPDFSAWVNRAKIGRIDLGISLLIWLAAVLVWQSRPIQPNWFVTDRVYPNFEIYPSSDARLYDLVAQSALVGSGFRFQEDFNIRRPLHGLYLTVLHLAAGQDYEALVSLQILVLAFFPLILFWMAKTLHNRISGVIVAALIILREANAISLSGVLTTAHAKLLLVDLPTALVLAGFFLIAILWLKNAPDNPLWAAAAGQALGLAVLLRPETMILMAAPAVVLFMDLRGSRRYGRFLRQLALFTAGLILILSPWVWRNWRQTGLIYLNDPYFRFGIIKQRFGPERTTPTPIATETGVFPEPGGAGEEDWGSSAQASLNGRDLSRTAMMAYLPPAASLFDEPQVTPTPNPPPRTPQEIEQAARELLEQELRDPIRLLQINSAHYLNSQLQTLLVFPSTLRGLDALIAFLGHRNPARFWSECCSGETYIRRLPYWPRWSGEIASQSILPLILNIVLIAAGIQVAWKRHEWTGLLILLGATIYLFGNAVFRNSGGRYILAVDWAYIVYFGIGLAHLSRAILSRLNGRELAEAFPGEKEPEIWSLKRPAGSWAPGLLAAGMLCLSLAMPIVERSFPVRYPVLRKAQMLEALMATDQLPEPAKQAIQAYLDRGAVAVAGRVLYPQFYPKNTGSLGKGEGSIEPMPFPRLVFSINGESNLGITLPVKGKPEPVPNTSDGLVLICPDDDYALMLATFDPENRPNNVIFISPAPAEPACPIDFALDED